MYFQVHIERITADKGHEHEIRYLEAERTEALFDDPSLFGVAITGIRVVSREVFEAGRVTEWKRDFIRGGLPWIAAHR